MMALFLVPTVWLWQEAKRVEQAKEDSMREYVHAMSKMRQAKQRRSADATAATPTMTAATSTPVASAMDRSGSAADGDGNGANAHAAEWEISKSLSLVHIHDGGDLFDHIVAPRSWDAPFASGPNGGDVVWAVFFYKPYCGACRRIRPTVEALAATVEDWLHLRFAAVDCVRHSYFCTAVNADETPIIHLFKKDPTSGKRAVAASWRGMLVSYVGWRHHHTAMPRPCLLCIAKQAGWRFVRVRGTSLEKS